MRQWAHVMFSKLNPIAGRWSSLVFPYSSFIALFFLSAILPQSTVAEVILPPISQYNCRLFEECFEKGLYRTATCYILVSLLGHLESSS